ncbi:uncharacterized protein LOC143279477 [Babylonia areolata]|uniref:uncharacterized protein LOC143279477 n=1 Tax=Babylonia areolata TaxID=304850 RepID=UPI003FD6A0C6
MTVAGFLRNLIAVLVLCGSSASERTSKRWQNQAAFDNRLPVEVNTKPSFTAKSRTACGVECTRNAWCLSFFHNSVTSACILTEKMYSRLTSDQHILGYRYYAIDRGACTDEDGYVTDWKTATCYRVVQEPRSWWEARAFCQQDGGTLAVLDTPNRAQFIVDLMSSGVYSSATRFLFIGASRPAEDWDVGMTKGQLYFVWENGQPVETASTFWGPSEPNGAGKENVLSVTHHGGWNDVGTQHSMSFICQRTF